MSRTLQALARVAIVVVLLTASTLATHAFALAPPLVAPQSTLLFTMLAIAAATLISEDLTCIATGLMVAHGDISFLAGTLACFVGIALGDFALFGVGRLFGAAALTRRPLRWFVSPASVEPARVFLERRGAWVVLATRFVPGTRLPTYLAAGLVGVRAHAFALWFLVAAALWTPPLVGLSAWAGTRALAFRGAYGHAAQALVVVGVLTFIAWKAGTTLASFRGRRALVSWWRRWTRWEFWPRWLFYPPVLMYVLWLGLRRRDWTVFTAANPAMPAGGFVGESKIRILEGLRETREHVAEAQRLPVADASERSIAVRRFMQERDLDWPVVLKPDVGERGEGVMIARSERDVLDFCARVPHTSIVQQYIPGHEFGVFYYRFPGEAQGRIFSITEKRMPTVTGDGTSTLEELVLRDPRAVALAHVYRAAQVARWAEVPAAGETVQLVELGTHCRGAIFLDGAWIRTPELEHAIDRISCRYDGFFFGRYDIRTPSPDDFRQGHNFKVVELNGVTSEATHIYDPQNGLLSAYRVLFEQWRIAREIGRRNVALGHASMSVRQLWTLVRSTRRQTRAARPSPAASEAGA